VTETRRLEVITGIGRRRRFTEDFKAQVIEETSAPGAVVSDVARRQGLTPQQVFTWRRRACQAMEAAKSKAPPPFVPAIVETAAAPSHLARKHQLRRTHRVDRSSGSIEIEIAGMTVRIGRGADTKTIAAVLQALKAGASSACRVQSGCWWRPSRSTSARAPRDWRRWSAILGPSVSPGRRPRSVS
jgi:transposase